MRSSLTSARKRQKARVCQSWKRPLSQKPDVDGLAVLVQEAVGPGELPEHDMVVAVAAVEGPEAGWGEKLHTPIITAGASTSCPALPAHTRCGSWDRNAISRDIRVSCCTEEQQDVGRCYPRSRRILNRANSKTS
jgi:hypothetical protein